MDYEVKSDADTQNPVVADKDYSVGYSADEEEATETVYNVLGNSENQFLVGSNDLKNAFIIESGNATISNYNSWETIQVKGAYESWTVDGNDFIVHTDNGSVRVQDARGKLMEFVDSDGSIAMHANMQVPGATFNGQGYDYTVYDSETEEFKTYNYGKYYEPVVVVGANNGENTLVAGDGGSVLWGGAGDHADLLVGGEGEDRFIYMYGNGNDVVLADENDIVDLDSVDFGQVKGLSFEDNSIRFVFNDFGSLGVLGRVKEIDINGGQYTPNYETKTFEPKTSSES